MSYPYIVTGIKKLFYIDLKFVVSYNKVTKRLKVSTRENSETITKFEIDELRYHFFKTKIDTFLIKEETETFILQGDNLHLLINHGILKGFETVKSFIIDCHSIALFKLSWSMFHVISLSNMSELKLIIPEYLGKSLQMIILNRLVGLDALIDNLVHLSIKLNFDLIVCSRTNKKIEKNVILKNDGERLVFINRSVA